MRLTIGNLAATLAFAPFLVLAVPASAAEGTAPAEDAGALRDIPPADWRQMTRGQTVTYRMGGEIWARESYALSGDTVAIRLADGTCMEGVWSWTDGTYCFAWSSGELSCFRHVRADGEILVIPTDSGGAVQTVSDISPGPVACGPAPVS